VSNQTQHRFKRRHSLRWRLLTLLAVMLLATLVIIGASVYYFILQNENRSWEGRQGEAARFAAETVAVFIQRTQDKLVTVSLLEPEILATDPDLLKNILDESPALLEILRLDASGVVLASANKDGPLLANLFTIPQSRWFAESKAGRLFLGNVQISSSSQPYLIISVPAPGGGAVAARLRMNVLWDVVAGLRFGESGQAYVVNRQGKIVGHTDPEVVLAFTTLEGRPEMRGILEAPDQRWSGSYDNFQGLRVIGVTRPVNNTDWIIVTEVAEAEAFKISRTALLLLGGGLIGLGVLVMLVMGQFLGQLILRPMERLRTGTVRIGQGDLNHQIGLNRQDEVGQVAEAFDEMVTRLRDREAQVAERTQALKESEKRFRQVISSISDHIYMTEVTKDGQRKDRYVSPNVETITGYPHQMFKEDPDFMLYTVIHPDDRNIASTRTKHFIRGERNDVEYRIIRANGEIIWVRDSRRVETDVDKQSLIIFGVVGNITERKEAEEAVARARDQALEASRFKTQLLANVSHDLRTPIGGILGFTEMLQAGVYGDLTAEQQGAMSEIIDSTRQLLDFINNLLNQARIEAGKITIRNTSFAPQELINNAQSMSGVLAQTKGLQLTSEIAPDVPPLLEGDPHWLDQILVNLVNNAIKFTEQGSVYIHIYLPDREHWALAVSDTGPGIPAEAQTYIFEAFRQVDSTLTRQSTTGSGLGLSIVKQLVVLMGGRVDLASELGKGSTFTVVLPLITVKEGVTL
jgi:PAS domain S-box-containing protein